MVQLLPVESRYELHPDFRKTYEDSFPEDERREWNQFLTILQNTQFKIHEIYDRRQFIGFISVWDLPHFIFIEHFAICAGAQRKGFGTLALKNLLSATTKPVILEAEDQQTESAGKRIAFYERLNFICFEGKYEQPAYSEGKKKVKMILMSYPEKINPIDFDEIKRHIYQNVYGLME